jgi:hypothetical protein
MNEQSPVVIQLPEEIEARCAERLQVARTHMAAGCWHWVEAGRQFAAIKEDLDGQWGAWCRQNNVLRQTADALIQIAKRFGDRLIVTSSSQSIQIDFEALRVLASPRVPNEAAEEAMSRAQSGERITKAKAEEMATEAVREAEAKFQAMVKKIRAEQEAEIDQAIEEATERLVDDQAELKREISRLRKAKTTIDVAGIAQALCDMLGKKTLSDDQWRSLAQILGKAIAHGKRVYEPITKEQLKVNEENLRIASEMTYALETLTRAPAPEIMIKATWPVQKKMHKRMIDGAIKWLAAYGKLIEKEGEHA